MSAGQSSPPAVACPPTPDALRQQAHQRLDEIIAFCLTAPGPPSFLAFEAALLGLLRSPGCVLIQLFLRPGGRSRPVAGRSPTSGPSSCRAAAAGPARTRWTWRWA